MSDHSILAPVTAAGLALVRASWRWAFLSELLNVTQLLR